MSETQNIIRFLRLGGTNLAMGILGGFFDDAGTSKNDNYVCWGGFIGTLDQWTALDVEWGALLAQPYEPPSRALPPLRRFHLSPCVALDGDYAKYTRPESDRLQWRFRDVIIRSGVRGLAYSVDRVAYDKLVQGEAREFLGDAEQLCFGACIKDAYKTSLQEFPTATRLALIFDNVAQAGRKNRLSEMAERFWVFDQRGNNKVGLGFHFEDMATYTPLQAADIIATESAWDAKALLQGAPRRAHFSSFLKEVRAEGYCMGEAEILTTLESHGFKPSSSR